MPVYHDNSLNGKTVPEAANAYIGRGWNPVPVGYRSKKPTNGEGWQHVRVTTENVTTHFNGGRQNVGVQMGPASNNLTDVDLDSDVAIALAPAFLPTTGAVFGRPTAPSSHWLYTTDLAAKYHGANLAFDDPRKPKKEGRFLELRIGGGGKGSQSVFPPSTHKETGEIIAWVRGGDPAVVDGLALKRAASLLASCCLLASYWPATGSGCHDAALAVGGFLARTGLEAEEVRNAVDAVAAYANPERREELARTAEDAANEFHAGRQAGGFPALAKAAGEDIAKQVAEWLDYRSERATSGVSVDAPPTPEDWPDPEPIPSGLAPVPALDPEILPEGLAPWLTDIAERMQVPLDFVAIPAMIMLGSLLGNKFGICPKEFDSWVEPANLWGMIIGRPGFMKSPAASEVFRPLRKAEMEAGTAYGLVAKQYAIDAAIYKKKREKAINSGQQPTDPEPEEPKQRRYFVNDVTYQKLVEILKDNPNGVLYHRDELVALLRAMRREENSEGRGFLMDAWAGKSHYSTDRIGRGHVGAPAIVSMFGTTQPGAISEFVRHAVVGGKEDDGLIQRLGLTAWPDASPAWANVDRYPQKASRDLAYAIFERLNKLTSADVGAEQGPYDDLPFLRFASDALRVFTPWREKLELRVRGDELPPALTSHIAKYRGLIPKLALLTYVIDTISAQISGSPDAAWGAVNELAIVKALLWAEYLEPHAVRLYGAAVEPARAAAKVLLSKLREGHLQDKPAFTVRDVYRNCWGGLTEPDHAQMAVDLLCARGWLWARHYKDLAVGRERVEYIINPKAKELWKKS
jgi:hypothetical protein